MSIGLAWRADITLTPATKIIRDYFRQRFLDPPNRHKWWALRVPDWPTPQTDSQTFRRRRAP